MNPIASRCIAAACCLAALLFTPAIRAEDAKPADANAPLRVEDYPAPIKLACIGDSITAGVGTKNSSTESYPAQLQKMLGDKWQVQNFGVSGSTLLNHGDKPYQKEPAFDAALKFKPDAIVIMLGTNDTKPQNWSHKDEFVADYKELIQKFRDVNDKVRVFICIPVPVIGVGNYGIVETGIAAETPLIQKLAADEHTGLIDMHAPLEGKDALIPDRVHPSTEGATLMAAAACHGLSGKTPQ